MSIYLGSSEPSKIYVGSSEVSAVFVGTQQVRPGEITETYTIAGAYYSENTSYVSIAKSGYKVSKIEIEGSCSSTEQYSGNYVGIAYSNNRTYEVRLSIDFGSSNTLGGHIRYRTGGTNYNDYSVPTSVISRTSNTYKVKFTRTGWTLTLNGNSYSGTYSSSMANIVETVMDSSTCQFHQARVRQTTTTTTATVTYTPN